MRNLKERGFTLIELMIAVAVVGILAAIAYPSYQNAQIKNRRALAQAHLMDIAQRQQQFLMDNRSFAGTVGALNIATPPEVSVYYTILITPDAGPPPGFTATATPIASKSQVSDGALGINNSGVKTPAAKW